MEKPHFSLIADVPYCVTMAFAIQLYANKISIFFLTKLDKKNMVVQMVCVAMWCDPIRNFVNLSEEQELYRFNTQ